MTGISQQAIENEIVKIIKKENEMFTQNAQQKEKHNIIKITKDLITKSSGTFAAQKRYFYFYVHLIYKF